MSQDFCAYYTARLAKTTTWFVSGVLRAEPNMVLERCVDKCRGEFEFFVPSDMEPHFLKVMDHLSSKGFVSDLEKRENRIQAGQL